MYCICHFHLHTHTHTPFQLPPRDRSRSLRHWSQHTEPSWVSAHCVLLLAFAVILPTYLCTEVSKQKTVASDRPCLPLFLLLFCIHEDHHSSLGHARHKGEGVWPVFPPLASQTNVCCQLTMGCASPVACGGRGTEWEGVEGVSGRDRETFGNLIIKLKA